MGLDLGLDYGRVDVVESLEKVSEYKAWQFEKKIKGKIRDVECMLKQISEETKDELSQSHCISVGELLMQLDPLADEFKLTKERKQKLFENELERLMETHQPWVFKEKEGE